METNIYSVGTLELLWCINFIIQSLLLRDKFIIYLLSSNYHIHI